MDGLLIRTKDEFDEFYHIGSHRLFLILVPILREIQRTDILPVVGKERFDWLVRRDPDVCDTLWRNASDLWHCWPSRKRLIACL